MNKRVAKALAKSDPRVTWFEDVDGEYFEFCLYRVANRGCYRPVNWYLEPEYDDNDRIIPGSLVAVGDFIARSQCDFEVAMRKVITEEERAARGIPERLSFRPLDGRP